ncbi:MAG: OmpA family protein [Thermodesulfovibrionales bacterium]|nr:OmpA family protein [Thermodesulfovibrionales bacterium]
MKLLINHILILAVFILVGCATKEKVVAPPKQPNEIVVLVADDDGKVGQITVRNEAGESILQKANTVVEIEDAKTPPSQPKEIDSKEIQAIFGEALKAKPMEPARFLFYFISGTTKLTKESEAQISSIVEAIKSRPTYEISVIGHTDTTGTDAFNMKLSAQRAEVVKEFLVSKGISAESITTSYHGKRDLLIPTGDNVSEPRNRRVEVVVR